MYPRIITYRACTGKLNFHFRIKNGANPPTHIRRNCGRLAPEIIFRFERRICAVLSMECRGTPLRTTIMWGEQWCRSIVPGSRRFLRVTIVLALFVVYASVSLSLSSSAQFIRRITHFATFIIACVTPPPWIRASAPKIRSRRFALPANLYFLLSTRPYYWRSFVKPFFVFELLRAQSFSALGSSGFDGKSFHE